MRVFRFFPVACLIASLIGCAPARVDLADPAILGGEAPTVVLVKRVEYDTHGRPLFRSVLKERPVKAGEQFTLVYYRGARPVKSLDIAIAGRKPDFVKPLKVIYDWTGNGFAAGAQFALEILPHSGGDKYAWVVPAASLVVGTAAGFVIGVGASVPVALGEAGALMSDCEVLMGFSEYAYDEQGRMRRMRLFLPDEAQQELVRTEFNYHGNETAPFETVVYSRPENKVRTIP